MSKIQSGPIINSSPIHDIPITPSTDGSDPLQLPLSPSSSSPHQSLNLISGINELLYSNLLWAEWISFSSSVALFGILIIYYSSLVPESIQRVFKYGKAADLHPLEGDGGRSSHAKGNVTKFQVSTIELPKRWFYHFYLFATIFYTCLAYSVIQVYFNGSRIPDALELLLNSIVGIHRKPCPVDPESVVIATGLLLIQVFRRLSECTLLSVYSDARMNVIHYIFGFSFYFGVGLSVLAEAPGFSGCAGYIGKGINGGNSVGTIGRLVSLGNWERFITPIHLIGIIMFIIGSLVQFHSHRILANLRKDTKGNVVTLDHSIPRGFLFNHISCPHYFAEILIYLSIGTIFRFQSMTWTMVCIFVVTNQIIVGLFNHHWYLQSFPDYPKSRKAIIPFLL